MKQHGGLLALRSLNRQESCYDASDRILNILREHCILPEEIKEISNQRIFIPDPRNSKYPKQLMLQLQDGDRVFSENGELILEQPAKGIRKPVSHYFGYGF